MHREELLRRLDRAGLVDFQRGLAALQDRAHAGKPAEEVLVTLGLVSEAALARLIADSYSVPFTSLADRYVSPEVARLVPRDVAENYALLPIELDGNLLTLAMADPMDLMAEDLVRFTTSCQIRRVMVPRSELMEALAAAYDGTAWPRPGPEERDSSEVELNHLADLSALDRSSPRLSRCTLRTPELEADLLVSSLPSLHGQKVVLRVLDRGQQLPELDRLDLFPETFRRVASLLDRPSGLILVSGPEGSGRTATVYAMLHHLEPQGRSLVALEDSWMPDLPGVTCIPVGSDPGTLSPRLALEAALLQDPDVVLLRGLPDRETADLALRAAGEVLVITTLEGDTALGAVQRLQRQASSPWQAVSNLLGVVAQRRVRRLCQKCREEVRGTRRREFPLPSGLQLPERHFLAAGCEDCGFTGFRDRVGLHEVLVVNEALRDLFWANAPEHRVLEAALAGGMVPLVEDGLAKVKVGLTSLEEVLRALPPASGGGRACATCRRELGEDWKTCPYCDPGLEELCPACRRPVQEDWKTCPYCRWGLAGARPSEETREEMPAVPGPSGEAAGPAGLETVLVADHEASLRAGILESLERSGYRVLLADDGQEAAEILQRDPPDLLLAGLRLPRVDGLELCRRARRMGLGLPILLLAADPDAGLRDQVLKAGGDGLLNRAAGASGWDRALARALGDRPDRAVPAWLVEEAEA